MYVPGQPYGRRVLAGRLRALRGYDPEQPDQEPDFSREEIAKVIMVSPGQYKHYETGARIIAPLELRTLVQFYRLSDEEYAELEEVRARANQPSEFASFGLEDTSYLDMEREASEIRTWQNLLVPGMLQAEAYMVKVFELAKVPASQIDQRIRARLKRQERLSEVKVDAVIAEEALIRCAKVPVQVARLAQLAEQDNIDIRIMPLWAGLHRGMDGSFTHLTLDLGYQFAYQDTASGSHSTDKSSTVKYLVTLFEELRDQALDATESLVLISRLLYQGKEKGPQI